MLAFMLAAACTGASEQLVAEPLVTQAGILPGIPAQLACPESPNCVSSLAPSTDTVHSIAPIELGTAHAANPTAPAIQATLKGLILAMPRTALVTEQPGYLHLSFTSKLFRFVDDVEIWFPPTQDSAPVIHIRSASRVGYGDMGVNRARVESIRQAWVDATRTP